MRLQLQTWQDIDTYLTRSRGIMIPIGSTEQHGPNGLIGTDALCPEVIAWHAAEQCGAVVGPTISVGMAQHHLAFSGSITLRPSTLIAMIRDYVVSLARHGFERFYFLNGHGGNIATVNAAFSEIYAEASLNPGLDRPHIRCKLDNWFGFDSIAEISAELFGDGEGSHATPSEISVTQAAYPESIRPSNLPPAPPRPRPFYDANDYRVIHPDGRIASDSAAASPAAGERLIAASAASVVTSYQAFLAEA